MPLTEEFGQLFKNSLAKTAVFTSFPLSLLMIPLEALVDLQFTCPCDVELNTTTSNLIFIAPSLFVFALMLVALQPFETPCICKCRNTPVKERSCECVNIKELSCTCINNYSCECKNFKENCWESVHCKECYCICLSLKDFFFCLIPSFIWIILVLLDGDYIACRNTDWNGKYVSDDELHVKWCKPTNSIPGRSETDLRHLTQSFIVESRRKGYYALIVLSILIISGVCYNVCYCCDETETNPKPGEQKYNVHAVCEFSAELQMLPNELETIELQPPIIDE